MSATLYSTFLVLHIIGITVMAGTTFIDFITFRSFRKAFHTDTARSLVIEDNLYKLQRFLGIGMLLILVSGIGMMVKLHELWGAQMWFRIKMGVLLLIIINGLALRRMMGTKLRKALAYSLSNNNITGIEAICKNLTIIQITQLLLFVIIYVLSIFKFN